MTACDDATAPEGDPPELPPQTSFVMDFGDFPTHPMAVPSAIPAAPAAGTYWTSSAIVVGVWNLIITGTLAPPVAAFIASFNHQAEWDEDVGAWVWSYTFSAIGNQYSARLEARLITDAVQWDMYISREGGFTDFHWYTGVSNASGLSGTWSLNRDAQDPSAYIDIDWSRAESGDTYEITYTNVVSGAPEYGSYITYGVTGDTPYDAFYDLYGAEGGDLTEIEWNRTTKEGRVSSQVLFGDSDWHCWDANLDDTTCD
jgi:hypothetical protein